MESNSRVTVGLVELPSVHLVDSAGHNWNKSRPDAPLIGKQVLMASLAEKGFAPTLVDLRRGDYRYAYGRVDWNQRWLTKYIVGSDPSQLDPDSQDAWGITVNSSVQREVGIQLVDHLTQGNGPIVVGGSDAITHFDLYLRAGASAVVMDKSGGSNARILKAALGLIPKDSVEGAVFSGLISEAKASVPMRIEDWPLPSVEIARQCLGGQESHSYSKVLPEHLKPVGAVFPDFGCDRACDFCQTPSYKLGYQAMSTGKTLDWLQIQREAGARSVCFYSDQFLGRIARVGGRNEILSIMEGARELGLAVLFSNGLDLGKMTMSLENGAGQVVAEPDQELVQSLCGWDGERGTYMLYVPAERPITGQTRYAKLLPWLQHCTMLKAVVRSGVPYIHYGVIIGFRDDSHDTLSRLECSLCNLRDELLEINPELQFSLDPLSLIPVPGTAQYQLFRGGRGDSKEDPVLNGSFWTPTIDSPLLSREEISDWQHRLVSISVRANESPLSIDRTVTSDRDYENRSSGNEA